MRYRVKSLDELMNNPQNTIAVNRNGYVLKSKVRGIWFINDMVDYCGTVIEVKFNKRQNTFRGVGWSWDPIWLTPLYKIKHSITKGPKY